MVKLITILLNLEDRPALILTKIIATIGPSCCEPDLIVRMIEEGARVFRINFSHGTLDTFGQALQAVRQAAETTGEPVGVLGDICGPKIRIGPVVDGGIDLAVGHLVEIQRQPILAGSDRTTHSAKGNVNPIAFSCTFPDMIDDVQPGERVLIDDGAVRALVIDSAGVGDDDRRLVCRVTEGGCVLSNKGINLPDSKLRIPSITDRDWPCINWAIEHELDFLALSFVRQVGDIHQLKQYLSNKLGKDVSGIPVIAKIEQPQALDDLDAIIESADGVMVARGDLGVEMDLTEVPMIQKRVIALAHDLGKPVIVATQMLQSMIENTSPTRAEVSDVANAIFDGADAVMLSGETAVGRDPVRTVWMMARIGRTAQNHLTEFSVLGQNGCAKASTKLQESRFRTPALAGAVAVIVRDLGAKLVFTWSQSGGGARYLSKTRLPVPIIAASSNPTALRQMTLMFAVIPVLMCVPPDTHALLSDLDHLVMKRGWGEAGDPVVVAEGEPLGISGVTNKIRIHYLGDVCKLD